MSLPLLLDVFFEDDGELELAAVEATDVVELSVGEVMAPPLMVASVEPVDELATAWLVLGIFGIVYLLVEDLNRPVELIFDNNSAAADEVAEEVDVEDKDACPGWSFVLAMLIFSPELL